jgi:pimeloyl-ACP methyl ester carboxylesterase
VANSLSPVREGEVLRRVAAANLARARQDLAEARSGADDGRSMLLHTLVECGGHIVLYRPALQHYALLFGDFDTAHHVAVVVPGVGDGTNLCEDWIPGARNLYEAAEATTVILWKGYDNPSDLLAAAAGSIECNDVLVTAASDLTAFVASLSVRPHQSLTVVAHSFGSIVTGAALADCGLRCTDVVVAGSPGMTVDELRQLHVAECHFFSEQAPGDPIAELGIFGTAPTSPTFGGTRLSTNAPNHAVVRAHSEYFEPGSQALENIVDVVMGRYGDVVDHRSTLAEISGGLVAWCLRLPAVPLRAAGRHYHGAGFRVLVNAARLVEFGASETGNLVSEVLDESGRVAAWVVHRALAGEPTRSTAAAGTAAGTAGGWATGTAGGPS